jgi:hypothetical protein
VQWGRPIGKHDAIAQKLGAMAADTFAMEALVELVALMADTGRFDIRLEAAIAKLWGSETGWALVHDAVQVRGGRGYETNASLEARGETAYPVERWLRDMRINMIFEGSSEIMRLFIAREAVDLHLKVAGDLVNPKAPTGARIRALLRAAMYYAWWYPSRFFGWGFWPKHSGFGTLAPHVRFIERASRRLARATFHAMVRFGPALEKRQAVLGRLVDIGADLFVMTAVVSRSRMLAEGGKDVSALALADLHCRRARRRIGGAFRALFANDDKATNLVAKRFLDGELAWLEKGVVSLDSYRETAREGPPVSGKPKSDRARSPEPARVS